MQSDHLENSVFSILQYAPLPKHGTALKSDEWELVSARVSGSHKGERVIGSANMAAAYSLICKNTITSSDTDSEEALNNVLETLVRKRLIRRIPEHVRKLFSVVK